jgi:hypothetical protein
VVLSEAVTIVDGSMLKFNETYVVKENHSLRGVVLSDMDGRLTRKENFDIAGGEWTPPFPLRLRQTYGRVWYDYLYTNYAIDLYSSRIIQALVDNNITGWRPLDVIVESKKGTVVEGYTGLVVTGRCGPIDNSRSEWNPPASGPIIVPWKGIYFDASTWDGADIFRPPRTSLTFLTRRVRDIFASLDATNIITVALSEIQRPIPGYPWPPDQTGRPREG